jgi:hypothetical protein
MEIQKTSVLSDTLKRLSQMTSRNQPKKGNDGQKQNKFFKAKPGKNNLLILPTPFTGDPFLEWAGHQNLLEVNFHTIPCNKINKDLDCIVCDTVDQLRADNWKGNFPIWKPLEAKISFYSPIINLDSLEDGVQWWRYGSTVLNTFTTWLQDLEGDELPFYDINRLEKIIVTYDKDADAAKMYSVNKKEAKKDKDYDPSKIKGWVESIQPLAEVLPSGPSNEEIASLLEVYIDKKVAELEGAVPQAPAEEISVSTKNKLDSLKN